METLLFGIPPQPMSAWEIFFLGVFFTLAVEFALWMAWDIYKSKRKHKQQK